MDGDGEVKVPGWLEAKIMQKVQGEIGAATKEAVSEALKLSETHTKEAMLKAEGVATEIMTRVQNTLHEIEVARPKVIQIKINDGDVLKLTHRPSKLLPRLIILAKSGLNAMLIGPAGCGKTIVAGQVAEALKLDYSHVTLTAGASETWLFGRQTATGFVAGGFHERYKKGGVFLADEMDGADPNMLLVVNTALSNGSMYNPILGEHVIRHENFVFIGAANTVGKGADFVYTGRNRLDGATLDRFVCIQVNYDPDIEHQVCPDPQIYDMLTSARKKLNELKSPEIISTRGLMNAYKQRQMGTPLKDIIQSMVMSWPPEIIKQCSLTPEQLPTEITGPKPESVNRRIDVDEEVHEVMVSGPNGPVKARIRRPKPKKENYSETEKCTCDHEFQHHSDGIKGPCLKSCTCRRFVPKSEGS